VEFALTLPLLVTLMLGVWEIGRLVQLQQLLSNAAREGARVAAQGETINSTGAPTMIQVSTGSPNVQDTVINYLKQAGLNASTSNVTVTFAFISGDTSLTQPYQGNKGQFFRVSVSLSTSAMGWSSVSLLGINKLDTSVIWTSLVDDPFTLDPTLPSW
jgi:Flp pilus assembly protein TadG